MPRSLRLADGAEVSSPDGAQRNPGPFLYGLNPGLRYASSGLRAPTSATTITKAPTTRSLQQVARMSAATCGVTRGKVGPGYRSAHPGYEATRHELLIAIAEAFAQSSKPPRPHPPPGSMPVALMTSAAAGDARNLNKARAAAGSAAVAMIPAEITLIACRSPGSGPSSP